MEASWRPLAELSSAVQKKRKQKNTMDLVDVCATTSTTHRKRVSKRKRARHRKAADLPPTMQNKDQRGPKTGEEPSPSKTTPQEAQPSPRSPSDRGRTLRFTCHQCKDSREYVSTDLVRHFEEEHRGRTPVFCCHTCPFSTQQFSYLQVHLWSHTDTFSSCSICNDNETRSWSEFSSHLTMHHCHDGQFSCNVCPDFSTGDVGVFLNHLCVHVIGPKRANEITRSVRSLHRKDRVQCGSITTAHLLRCQHCGYEASHKWLLDKHVTAKHVSQVANCKKNSKPVKPTDPITKMKPRLTRSAVREMCWLTQDCLSLPGRQFLDRYCHLPDPQTTLDETQHFLMKSVAGETGNHKWTNALKNVLSNVPQEMNLHPKSENGTSNPSDLTVLTVKNRIIVTQNGATYARRLRRMASAGKEAPPPDGALGDAYSADGAQLNGNETDPKLNPHASMSAQVRPPQQENRENQELTTDPEEHGETTSLHEDASDAFGQLTAANESHEQTSPYNAQQKHKRRKRRKRRRPRRAQGPSALALKLVLKKSPKGTKGKQWVSESPRSTNLHGVTSPDGEEKKGAESCDPSVAMTTSAPSLCAGEQTGDTPGAGGQDGVEADSRSENPLCSSSSALDGATAPGDKASARCRAAFPPQGETHSGDSARTLRSEQGDRTGHLPADPCADPGDEALQQGSSPAAVRRWQPAPKSLVRTLKLVAINPCQPVRRPARHQPVVVLNHPDADVPEVARVMEVVNRYGGEVQKVILSRRTLRALSGTSGESSGASADHGGRCAESSVQERFTLKLKLRKLSRKKYEVVRAPSPRRDVRKRFCCWFCGRVFVSQDTWRVHRRRHLMEWNGPKCERP